MSPASAERGGGWESSADGGGTPIYGSFPEIFGPGRVLMSV